MEIIFIIIIIIALFMENMEILNSLIDGNGLVIDNGYVFITIIADIVLFCFMMKKWGLSILSSILFSFLSALKGYFKRITAIKQSISIKKNIKDITESINRLKEIKKLGINRSNIERTYNLCQLLADVSDKEQLQECFDAIDEKRNILTEIDTIEHDIIKVAERYKNIGDAKRCAYYLRNISENQSTLDIIKRKRECEGQLISCEEEKERMKTWGIFFIFVIVIAISFLLVHLHEKYIEDTPYRELDAAIENHTLTSEMCDMENKDEEDSYYTYFKTEKGYKLLASKLTKFHKKDDIQSAMWLLCTQPDLIDGACIYASDSFINWIVDYAKENGTKQTSANDNIVYCVDGYEIMIHSASGNSREHFLEIDNEQNCVKVGNIFRKKAIPIH